MLDYGRQEQVRDQIMTSIWYALRRAEIEIPFPIRDVFIHTDGTAAADRNAVEQQRISALRAVDFLAELEEAELDVLRSNLAEAVFGHGEIICREGDTGDAFFVLHRGEVAITARGAGGQETPVAELKAPAFFGEMALLTGEPRSATVRAKGDAELLILEHSGFQELFKIHPNVAAEVSRVLAMRQSELRERREQSVVPESTESRSRRLLVKMQAIFRF
jgi:CRP-like cAMP-binding protein